MGTLSILNLPNIQCFNGLFGSIIDAKMLGISLAANGDEKEEEVEDETLNCIKKKNWAKCELKNKNTDMVMGQGKSRTKIHDRMEWNGK